VLPHAMREFATLGLEQELLATGIENRESAFFNRFGQLIYREERGRHAGYAYPEVGVHRGRLQMILYREALRRLGPDRILLGRQCVGIEQDENAVHARFVGTASGRSLEPVRGDVVVACDGFNSAVRHQFYPDETPAFAGINTWRGITRFKPILDGRTYIRIGSIRTGKMVIYPIIDAIDDRGHQLVNWMAEIEQASFEPNDWNKPGRLEDFLPIYSTWRFNWLDVPDLIRRAEQVLEYPMVDKDPVERWTFGRVTLAGDAAHPMYPRGSNGAAQAAIDARTLADCLVHEPDARQALIAYEDLRRPATAKVVRTNRESPPDVINIRVEELVGDRPFDDLDRYISQNELRALSDNYKRTAGFSVADLAAPSSQ
jgi:5-methylphenazine-1-carboxylate 1-monooxygenase